jgi:hypothetical protein
MRAIPPVPEVRASRLRVARGEPGQRGGVAEWEVARAQDARPALHIVHGGRPLLVAGADSARRSALLEDLLETMPEGTCFEQASSLSEVLERAPWARMVILSGGLEDASANALMGILGQRHPTLPIINLDPAGLEDI